MKSKLEFHKLQDGEVMIYNTTVLTKADIIEIISISGAEKEIFEGLQERKFEKLQPMGFEYAPESAKEEREEYKNTNNLEKLQWIQDNISYNADGTMNILKLHKTFCEDLSGTIKRCNWEEAKVLAESKGYTLPTDYNDCDSDEVKQESDRYKVINIFSNGKGDTVKAMKLFSNMAGCDGFYWTDTLYKVEKGEEVNGRACHRELRKNNCGRYLGNADNNCRACGLKDME